MKKRFIHLAGITIATLLLTNSLSGQRIYTPPQQAPNYFTIRTELQQKADAAEQEREKYNRWHIKKRLDEVPEAMALEQWDWFWGERMLVNGEYPGQLANVSEHTVALASASAPNLRGAGGPGGPSTASAGAVCSGALGSWISLGPSSYPVPVLGNIETLYIDPANSNNILAGSSRGGLFKTTNNGLTWTNITDAGRLPCMGITAIQVNPSSSSTIFIGTSSGLPYRGDFGYGFGVFRTTDNGSTWTIIFSPDDINNGVFENTAINDMLLHPQDPNIMFVLMGNKVYRSTNINAATPTWAVVATSSSTPGTILNFTDIDIISGTLGVLNSKVVLCTSQEGYDNPPLSYSEIYYSSNGGASFANITSVMNPGNAEPVVRYIAAKQPGNTTDIYFGSAEPLAGGASEFVLKKYTFATNSAVTIGNIVSPFSYATLYTNLKPNFYKFEMEFSLLNSNRLYVGGENLYSLNLSGNSIASNQRISEYWPVDRTTGANVFNTHCDIRDLILKSSGSNDVIFAGTDGGVCKATCLPTGALSYSACNWVTLNGSGLAIGQYFDISGSETNYNLLLAGAQDNGTFEWSLGSWKLRELSDGYNGIINPQTNFFYGNSNFGIFRGATGSASLFSYIFTTMMQPYNAPVVSHPNNPNYIITSLIDEFNSATYVPIVKLYYSNNLGQNLYPINTFPLDGQTRISAIQIAPSDPNVIYVAKRGYRSSMSNPGKLYKSTDGGASWTDIGSLAALPALTYAGITSITVDPFNANRVFIGMGSYWSVNNSDPAQRYTGINRVLKSENGGSSWTDITNASLPACPINALAYRTGTNDEIYAGNDFGVYRYN
ncbi:MAG: WD40/YVTN/BNR-like repeat-containing protein, partial [Bacteroidia bacterium]